MSTRVLIPSLLATVLIVSCTQKPDSPAAKKKPVKQVKPKVPAKKAKPRRPGDKRLWAAFDQVLANCNVSEWGFVRRKSCKKPGLEAQLKKREKEVGQKATLLTYCAALGGDNHLGRALASYRISSMNFAQRMAEAADKPIFECLLKRFAKIRRAQHVRRLALAVTYMGTALKEEQRVIAAVEKHPMREAREASYGALWANGRLRVFSTLEKVVKKSGDPKLQVAAIKSFGFGQRPTPAERKQLCALLIPYMTDAELDVASAAAYRVAAICRDHKDSVIKASESLIAKGKFTLTYVSALRSAAGLYRDKASDVQRKAIVAVLEKVLASSTVVALTRSSALTASFDILPKVGKQLARKYLKDKEKFVADEAARLARKRVR
jgi:hypothetical protein